MRQHSNDLNDYEVGDKRTIIKFVFLPKKLGKIYRWLEKTSIEQIVIIDESSKNKKFINSKWADIDLDHKSNKKNIGFIMDSQ